MDPVNSNFDRVAKLLPFSYGKLEDCVNAEKNKMKMKKRNLRKAIKGGYIWDSYKYMSYKEWRDANGYSIVYSNNSIFKEYQKYRNKHYRTHYAMNNKYADIQSFNLICNLLDECQYEPPVTPPRNVEWDCDWVIGCI
eukprot:SAG22_NODE_6417_length_858_cov_81.001318_2_plen_138_part_00